MHDTEFEREMLIADIGAYRPYVVDGRKCVTLRNYVTKKKEVVEYTGDETTWKKDEWIRIDRLIHEQFREHAPLLGEILTRGCQLIVKRDGSLRDGSLMEGTKAAFELSSIPLRIRWTECKSIVRSSKSNLFSARRLNEAAKRLAETVECIFCNALISVAGPLAYNLEESEQILRSKKYYGRYTVCLPETLNKNGEKANIICGSHLTIQSPQCESAVMFQMTPDTIRAIVALWPIAIMYNGNFRIVCCVLPQVRSDNKGNYGVCRITNNGD